jgi:hypothetical protein
VGEWSQATIMRAVKAALEPARKMGLPVTGYKVSFHQGVPCVDVTLSPESAPAAPAREAVDVQALKERIRGRHERRS